MNFKKQKSDLILFVFIFILQKVNSECLSPQILALDEINCIYPSECEGFEYNSMCVESCPSHLWTYYDGDKPIGCKSSCSDSYYEQLNSKKCKHNVCDVGFLGVGIQKCFKKEDCASISNGYCIQECNNQNQYPVRIDGQYQCRFCQGFIQKLDNSETVQCVNQCSSNKHLLVDNNVYSCSTQYYGYTISSDKKYYSKFCIPPDINYYSNEKKDIMCIKQCPENYKIYFDGDMLSCKMQKDRFSSSDNKYLLFDCKNLFEIRIDQLCIQCTQDQYKIFNNYEIINCISGDQSGNVGLRLESLKIETHNSKILLKKQYDYFTEQLSLVLSLLEKNNLMLDRIKDLTQTIFSVSQILDHQFCFSPMVFKSNSIKIISQKLYVQQLSDYNTSFSISKLRSDNPDNLKIPNKTQYRSLDFFPQSLFLVISEKNYLCKDSYLFEICFLNSELVQIFYDDGKYEQIKQSPQFNIIFDNVDVKNINKYVCLTTKQGIMSKSLKTEVINNPTGVKCTFRENGALFLDSKGLFNEKSCPVDKPYLLNQICVLTCPYLIDLFLKKCISKLEECSYIYDGGKKCVDRCSGEYPYQVKNTEIQTVCQKSCLSYQIPFEDQKECLWEKEQCNEYLIDEKKCSKQCPKEYYLLLDQKTPYKSCNSTCKFFFYKQGEQKICSSICLNNQIVDYETKVCYNQKQECSKFISSNEKECISKCGYNQYFEVINGYKQCRTCTGIIKQENNVNTCVAECGKNEMIFQQDNNDRSSMCVTQDVCSKSMISAKNPNLCSNQCIKPEVKHGSKCVESCPQGLFFSPQDNSCSNECNQYYSSDEKLCVETCGQLFEVVDQFNQTKKKCKACASNEYFSKIMNNLVMAQGFCNLIKNTADDLETMKRDVSYILKNSIINSVQELEASQKIVISFATQIQTNLKDLTNKSEPSQQDLSSAQSDIQSVLDITKLLHSKVNFKIQEKPLKISTEEFTVTSQVSQPGKIQNYFHFK